MVWLRRGQSFSTQGPTCFFGFGLRILQSVPSFLSTPGLLVLLPFISFMACNSLNLPLLRVFSLSGMLSFVIQVFRLVKKSVQSMFLAAAHFTAFLACLWVSVIAVSEACGCKTSCQQLIPENVLEQLSAASHRIS